MRFRLAAAVVLALAAGGPALTQAQVQVPVKVALIEDQTGPLEAYAKQLVTGFRMGHRVRHQGHQHRRRPQDRDHREGQPVQAGPRPHACWSRPMATTRWTSPSAAPPARSRWPCCRWRRTTRSCSSSTARWPTASPARSGTATSSASTAIPRRTRSSNALSIGKPGVVIATLAQDYAFGRDGVAAFKRGAGADRGEAGARGIRADHHDRFHRADAAHPRRARPSRAARRSSVRAVGGRRPDDQAGGHGPGPRRA